MLKALSCLVSSPIRTWQPTIKRSNQMLYTDVLVNPNLYPLLYPAKAACLISGAVVLSQLDIAERVFRTVLNCTVAALIPAFSESSRRTTAVIIPNVSSTG
jgi:hypothetical protein